MNFVDDRGDDVMFASKLEGRTSGGVTFGNGLRTGGNIGRIFTAPDSFAETAIAAMPGKAGDHQVAQAAQAGEGFGLRAASDAEAGDFGDGRSDQGRLRVVAESQAVADTGGQGDDVFDGAA